MNAFNFLPSSVVDALGWTLLHAVWQGFALVLPVAVLLHLLRNQSSNLRYQISVFTLLAQLLASTATFFWYYKPDIATTPLLSGQLSQQLLVMRLQVASQNVSWTYQFQQFLQAHLSEFVLIYLVGVALFGLRLAGGWVYLQRLTKTATAPTSVACKQLVSQLRSSLAIRSVVRVLESAHIAVPMVVGMLKPVVLMPIGLATQLTPREVEAVLAHELAHIKRHDYAVNLLQSVVEVLYFFHPALWWLSARVREEREHCCDDLAVAVCGGDGHVLAQALAHVEELRLMQLEQTPILGMALASNRQHLLYRVRRMLGVANRPFVSNSSLAGLTLATLLLMSVSVYAVQKQDKPVRKTTQPKPTRKHKIDRNSEYGMANGDKVSYIIWKGQKLSSARVATLQREMDDVMGGKLSLDNVPKSDRDILLTIIEKNAAFDGGMAALAEGISHIDYDNIVASATNNVSVQTDVALEKLTELKELANVNYNAIVNDALSSLATLQPSNDSLNRLRAVQQRRVDSLSQIMAERSKQMETLHSQMERLRFPIEASERSQQVLEWKKQKLEQQRQALIEKHQQLLYNEGKQKLSQVEIEKQLSAIEPDIKTQETGIEELNKQLDAARQKIEEARLPIEKLERESMQLQEQLGRLSDQLDRQHRYRDQEWQRAIELNSDLNMNLNSDLNMDLNVDTHLNRTRWKRIERDKSVPRSARTPRPVIAPRVRVFPGSPTPALAPVPPAAADAPDAAPIPNVRIVTPPAKVARPRYKPKPAAAPKPE
ncbi:M48 family metalloprotease [Spirosoma sp. BT702]|uniref:M48 family metalloprotease n=1 Tax=Spirosoma profusum TaxID=2771354 RepID=A0A926XZ64_9BACT|nr:M56 family metallopeptidase [Spirosoma profusum]MBD2703629.1 M48 family metalloprotease [Spirosoma profusum]